VYPSLKNAFLSLLLFCLQYKATNCVPISNAAKSGNFTKEEVDYKIKLIEAAYGVKYVY
jgi:hypothetical protein